MGVGLGCEGFAPRPLLLFKLFLGSFSSYGFFWDHS